jgi:DNA-binding transcriptional MerR regulator/predicted RNase H-like HicB family nuclease
MKLTTPIVARVTGATQRQLRHWAKTGLLEPTAKKTGHRRYTFPDVVAVSTVLALRKGGCSLQQIRKAVRHLSRRLGQYTAEKLASLTLLTDGRKVYMLNQDHLREALTGQTVMCLVVRIGPLVEQAERRLRKLDFAWVEPITVRGRRFTLHVAHDPDDGGYSVQCRELPGAIEQGQTPEQAVAHGRAAVESVLGFLSSRARSTGVATRARS